MTQAGSRGNPSGIAKQMLAEGSTFFLGVAKPMAMSPPYPHHVPTKGLSVMGEKGADMWKGRERRWSRGRVMMAQNLVFSSRCQEPGPYSNFSALMGYPIMHGIMRANQFLNQFLKQVGFLLIANKKVRQLPKIFLQPRNSDNYIQM